MRKIMPLLGIIVLAVAVCIMLGIPKVEDNIKSIDCDDININGENWEWEPMDEWYTIPNHSYKHEHLSDSIGTVVDLYHYRVIFKYE